MSVRTTLRLVSLTAFAATLAACTEPTETPAEGEDSSPVESTESAIVGGKATTAHPAVGAFIDGSGPFCTGTVIAKRTVVTAAHCVEGVRASRIAFVLGASAFQPEALVRVTQLVPHPRYDSARIANDIAVAVLAEDAPVTPIPINTQGLDASWVGRSLLHVGYGVSNGRTGAGSGTKRSVTMPISAVGGTQFAYGDRTRNTCFGDSGGPALLEGAGGSASVVGVTSYGDQTCTQFGVDTRVDAFQSFVAPFLGN